MVVIAIVAVVLLGVFKLFNSVYFSYMESENYNTVNAINALSNIKKYYESKSNINISLITEDVSYVDLTDLEKFNSDYYDRLKNEFKIDGIYLIDLNKLYSSNDINDFYLSFRKYLNTLKNIQGIVLVVSLNENEYAYTQIENYQIVTLVGDKEDEFGIYINIGDEFVDPGYKNWEGEEPTITWENDLEVDTNKAGTYYKYYDFNGYLLRRKIVVGDFITSFEYAGDQQVYEVPYDGYYNLEVWGAEGGSYDETYIGGYGGYSSGKVYLEAGTVLYINVGGKGESKCYYKYCLGGYNGGGRGAGSSNPAVYSSGGGGATHIALSSGLLSDLESIKEDILIVAGGGGGTSYQSGGVTGVGGSGGGHKGNNGTNLISDYLYGSGGNQESGGEPGSSRGTSGSFGMGGNGNDYSGGGGGGYYGGGASNQAGAGGGSGYIGNSLLTNKVMYCYDCDGSTDETTKTISTTNVSEIATSNYAKIGDGFARIMFVRAIND